MKQRKYFEIFAMVGRKIVPDRDLPSDVNTLLDDMEYARIHGCAILANEAEEYSFVYGNKKCLETADKNPRLVSIAVVPTTANFETQDKNYIENLIKDGAVAISVTAGMRCVINAESIKEIADVLIKYKKPLVITGINDDTLERVDAIAGAYPALNILLVGTNWGFSRTLIDILRRRKNIYFDISSFHLNRLMEMTRENFGIDRVLYSSTWPVKSMGAMKAFVEYSELSEEEKDMVAFGNACRLFGLCEDDFKLYDEDKCQLDAIARQADAGKAISVPVIDAHTHMVQAEDVTVNNCVMMYSDCDSIVKKMDIMGVDTIITAPWSGINFDGIKGNEETLYAAKKHPGRILGYGTCNVNYEKDLREWKEYYEKYPDIFVGIKPYFPSQKFDFTDEKCKEWFEYANEHHLPALIHAEAPSNIEMTEKIIGKYPNITFLIAHTGSGFDNARRAVQCAKKFENVVLEITYTTTGRGMIEFLVDEVGADRVLYGSDLPMRDPAPQMAWVCYAKISEEDKKKILSENIVRILKKIK